MKPNVATSLVHKTPEDFKMKRTLLAAALATLACGTAFAQSSVTIYGRLNETVERQKTGTADPVWRLFNNSSRIGFKGSEDLGGGLKAGFQIEHGFSPDTGAAAGTFWGRQSEVNIGGGYGLLRLGNFTSEAYFATADYISMHNHDTGTSSDALYAYLGRDINKIAYRTPSIGGLTVEGGVSLGESSGLGRTIDVAANYAIGPVQLGAGYERVDATGQKQFAIRGLYEIGSFVVGAYVQRDENGYASGKRTTTRLTGMYTLGSSELHLNFGNAGKYSSVANSGAKQFTVGYNYNMSKRTKLYTFYTKVDNKTAASYATGIAGADFQSFALGIRHNF
jgi:predicted porin